MPVRPRDHRRERPAFGTERRPLPMEHGDRLRYAGRLGLVAVTILVLRLLQVQVLPSEDLRNQRAGQHGYTVAVEARRGSIFDRHLEPLAHTVADAHPSHVDASSSRNGRLYEGRRPAAHVVGFIGADGAGLEGVELIHDAVLTGTAGEVQYGRFADRQSMELDRRDPVGGGHVVLSLDRTLQEAAYRALETGARAHRAESASVIVLDPISGEVLVMTNYPSFESGQILRGEQGNLRNRAITDALEPGSVFKVVTFAAAMERQLFAATDTIDCGNGRIRLRGHTIRDVHAYDKLSFEDVLVHSSNVGTIRVAEAVGSDQLYAYAKSFGFGEPTGIDLPGEGRGLLNAPGSAAWSGLSRPCLSIGQEVSVTTLQMASAMGVLAAEGILVEPHMVLNTLGEDGRKRSTAHRRPVRRVVSPGTAAWMTRVLTRAVEEGTGKSVAIPGVRIAGKTGTAQRPADTGGFAGGGYNSTFVGYLPDRDPPLVIAVAVVQPLEGHFGAEVAGPIFRQLAELIVRRDKVRAPTIRPSEGAHWVCVPALRNRTVDEAREELEALGLRARVEGEIDLVSCQNPLPGTRLAPGSAVLLWAVAPALSDTAAVQVPELRGMTIRDAHRALLDRGLRMRLAGGGLVVGQLPAAGEQVALHSVCAVRATPGGAS